MSDLWEKQQLAEHRDQLARSRQAETERAREQRERLRNMSKADVAEIAKEGNLEAIKLLHELEPEKRHWDLTALIEEERIKLATYTSQLNIETREQIRLITAELMRELVLRDQDQLRDHTQAELKHSQTSLEHEYAIERTILDHHNAKDFKTHETDEFIRLRRALGALSPEDLKTFFAEFERDARTTADPRAGPGPTDLKG